MKKLHSILTQFRDDLRQDIPNFLIGLGLPTFENIQIGQSRNPDERALLIYKDEYSFDEQQEVLSLFFQLQLQGVELEDSLKIEDELVNYFKSYEIEKTGATRVDFIKSITWPIENSQGFFIFITITLIQDKDSCDD